MLLYILNDKPQFGMRVVYGEPHPDSEGRLFYAEKGSTFSEEDFLRKTISGEDNKEIYFALPNADWEDIDLGLDLYLKEDAFTLSRIYIECDGTVLSEIKKGYLDQYIKEYLNCEKGTSAGRFHVLSDSATFYFGSNVNEQINFLTQEHLQKKRLHALDSVYPVLLGVTLGLYCVLFVIRFMRKQKDEYMGWKNAIIISSVSLILWVGISLNYCIFYLRENYGDLTLEKVLFHLNTPLEGTNIEPFLAVIYDIFCIGGCISFFVIVSILMFKKIKNYRGYIAWLLCLGSTLIFYPLLVGYIFFDYPSYSRYIREETDIYENYYVKAEDVNLTFPDSKRNLIFIYLESMEISFADRNIGGMMEENYIPDLSALALQYCDFSRGGS